MSSVELLPALVIVAPILAASVTVAIGSRIRRAGWTLAAITCGGLFAAAVAIAVAVYGDGRTLVHALGGYPGPYGIELVADEFSALIGLLVTGTTLGVLAYTRVGGPRGATFYAGYLLLSGGLLGITFTGDVFNMFVFLEITGLATYALIASGDTASSAVAALKYLILGTVGASLYLLGVGLLFVATGTLNMADLASQMGTLEGANLALARAAFAFVFVGFAIKVAQWPVHTWQPDAYQRAPDGVTVLIAALVSTVYAYALGRVLYSVFGVDFLASTPYAREVMVAVGATSVLAGSLLAVLQRDVKRMFAYSSVSQFGLVIAAYGLLTEMAFVGAVFHLVGHGLVKAGLFAAAGVIAAGYGARTVDEYAGLARRRPVPAAAVAVLGVALVGIPPSVGFVGKWYIALGAVEARIWPVAAVIFLSTMLTLLYVTRLIETMYFTPAPAVDAPCEPTIATDGGGSEIATDGGGSEIATNGGGPDGAGSAVGTDGGDPAGPADDTDAVASDGGAPGDVDTVPAFDGDRSAVSFGMLAVVLTATTLAVLLGFAGGPFADLLEPFVTEVFASA